MKILPVLLLIGLAGTSPAAAVPDLADAASGAGALVAKKPEGTAGLFDKSFFRQISLEKLEGVFSGLYRDYGAVEETVLVSSGAYSGHFFLDTDGGWRIPAALSIEPATGKITGLFFSPAYRKDARLADIREKLAALPGRKGLLVKRLGPGGAQLEALDAAEQFAVGSAFKLYVLGAVLEKRVPWDRLVWLRDADRSLPTGRLRDWPAGTAMTVNTLAAMMISESDNTATDNLITGLGRSAVEDSLVPLGHSAPERMKPFLRTHEMFRLKSGTEAALKYMNLPADDRYSFLGRLAGRPLEAERFTRSPFGIDKIEWFASPADLCRLMEYFMLKGDSTALGVLAINPGLKTASDHFTYAGYKGGSEPGVLSMTWLLGNKSGEWFCLSSSWNDEKHNLEEGQFFSLMNEALAALAAPGKGQKPAAPVPQGP